MHAATSLPASAKELEASPKRNTQRTPPSRAHHSRLSSEPTMRWSPVGCTAMDVMTPLPATSLRARACLARLYTRTWWEG